MTQLSTIVLCYRASAAIHLVLEPLHEQLEQSGIDYELILVANFDAGRSDDTPDVVRAFAESHPNTRTVIQPKRGAMGWDMRTGLDAAKGEYLIVLDGDAQNPVEDVVTMYRLLRSTGVGLLKGRRIARFDGPYRRLVSYLYNLLFVVMFGTWAIRDINGKPKGLPRAAYERMALASDDWFIDAEMVLKAHQMGMTIAEMPVVFKRNEERASFVRAAAIFEFLRNMFRARFGIYG